MKLTANYGLRKPDGNDAVNIEDLNYNADILDKKVKEVESNAGSVKSVNGKTGAVVLNAVDIKTSSGASVESQLAETAKKANEAFQSGVNAKNGVVTALTSKKVNVTTNNSWGEIANAIQGVKLGDYSIGDTLLTDKFSINGNLTFETSALSLYDYIFCTNETSNFIFAISTRGRIIKMDKSFNIITSFIPTFNLDCNFVEAILYNDYIYARTDGRYLLKFDTRNMSVYDLKQFAGETIYSVFVFENEVNIFSTTNNIPSKFIIRNIDNSGKTNIYLPNGSYVLSDNQYLYVAYSTNIDKRTRSSVVSTIDVKLNVVNKNIFLTNNYIHVLEEVDKYNAKYNLKRFDKINGGLVESKSITAKTINTSNNFVYILSYDDESYITILNEKYEIIKKIKGINPFLKDNIKKVSETSFASYIDNKVYIFSIAYKDIKSITLK